MAQLNKTALLADITSNIYTNVTKNIKGNTSRDRFINLMDSTLNKTDDADANNGYMAIDSGGKANVTKIKSATPAGKFLRDDGSWQAAGVTGGGTSGHIPYTNNLNQLVDSPLIYNVSDDDFELPKSMRWTGPATGSALVSTVSDYIIGAGDNVNLSAAGVYSRIEFSKIGNQTYFKNYNGINESNLYLDPNNGISKLRIKGTYFTDIILSTNAFIGASIISTDPSFIGLNYNISTAGYVTTNGGNYSVFHRLYNDGRYAPITGGSYLAKAGDTATGNILFSGGYGIDAVATGGTDTLNIGTSGADVINIGWSGAQINMIGSVVNENVTNLTVKDKLITLNKGGATSSGVSVGFEIEENSIITGYFATNGTRDGYDFKAPGVSDYLTISLASLAAHRTLTAPNVSGTIITTGDTGTVTNTMLAGSIAYSKLVLTGSVVNGDIVSVAWGKITGTPTTIGGYGITDSAAGLLTGYTSGAGTVSASDTILQGIQKLNGNIGALVTGVSSVYGRTGAIVATSGDYTTLLVTENTNLYFTNARAIASTLTGYVSGAGTVSASDSVLSAIQKLNGNIAAITSGVSSVFGRTGAVVATSGDYTTAQVTESGNLYYTNARAIAATLTGYSSGAGTISSSDSILSALQKLNGNDALKAPVANPTFTGTVTLAQDAASNLQAVTLQQLNNAILGTDYKQAALYVATTTLPTYVYNNGSSGVGATITGVSFGAITFDGVTPNVGDRVLVPNEVGGNAPYNGPYIVTTVGGVASLYVLTRTTDFNQSNEITSGDAIFISAGNTKAASTYVYNGITAPTVGTTNLTFVQTQGAGVYSAGSGITLTSNTFSISAGAITYSMLASMTSAQFAGVVSDETGSGSLVFGTAPTITGGAITALTNFALRDTSAAFNLTFAATSSTALTAGRTLTYDVVDASRTIKLAGNIDLAGNLTTSGAYALTLTLTGATNITLPTSGTLLNNALASAKMYVGNGSGVATGVTMSGDVTNDNAGVQTIANNAVTYTKSYNGNQLTIINTLRIMSGN